MSRSIIRKEGRKRKGEKDKRMSYHKKEREKEREKYDK